MRLIDADKLKETLLRFNYTTEHNQIFRYIDDEPTAYDVDKVVEQLNFGKCCDCSLVDCPLEENCVAILCDGFMEKIREIVKAGGQYENS